MIYELFKLIIAPLAIVIAGSFLARIWQELSWRTQQRQAGAVRDYEAIHELWQAIDHDASSRLFAARRLLSSFEPDSKIDRSSVQNEYIETVRQWNRNLYSIYNRSKLLLGWSYTKLIEDDLHYPFVELGRRLNGLSRRENIPATWDEIQEIANMSLAIQISMTKISSSILNIVERKRNEISEGIILHYSSKDIRSMSNSQLIKLLFVDSVQGVNFSSPLRNS